MKRGEEFNEVNTLDDVVGAQIAPGFIKGCGCGEVAAASGDGGDEDAHQKRLPDWGGSEKDEMTKEKVEV